MMKGRIYHIVIILMVLCGSCIEPYTPDVGDREEVLVINGFLTHLADTHYVEVSRSAPFNNPRLVPVSGCVVTVEDESGSMVEYYETKDGKYQAYIEQEFLEVGNSYSLYVSTPEGKEYRCDHQEMLACAPVNDFYFEVEQKGTANPEIVLDGVQFYVDVKGPPDATSNYRWFIEETWEYTAPFLPDFIYDGKKTLPYDSDSLYYCTITTEVNEIHSR
jgi:hypothetical protein